MYKERTCGECKWWDRMTASTGPACLAFHGWYGPGADEPACSAFDDGSFNEAVDELVKSAYIVLARIVEYHDAGAESERLHSAIYAVERLLKEREK